MKKVFNKAMAHKRATLWIIGGGLAIIAYAFDKPTAGQPEKKLRVELEVTQWNQVLKALGKTTLDESIGTYLDIVNQLNGQGQPQQAPPPTIAPVNGHNTKVDSTKKKP